MAPPNNQGSYYPPPPAGAGVVLVLPPGSSLGLNGDRRLSRLELVFPNLSSWTRAKLRTSVPVPLSAPPSRSTRLRQPVTSRPRLWIRRLKRLPPTPLSVNRRLSIASPRMPRSPKGASPSAPIDRLACPPAIGLLNIWTTLEALTPPLVASESLLLPTPRQTAASDIFYRPVVPAIDTPTVYSAPKHAPSFRIA